MNLIFNIILLFNIIISYKQQLIDLPIGKWAGIKDTFNNFFVYLPKNGTYYTYDSSKTIISTGSMNNPILNGDIYFKDNNLISGNENTISYYPNLNYDEHFSIYLETTIFLSFFESSSKEIFIIGIINNKISFIKVNSNDKTFDSSYYEFNPQMAFNRLHCHQKDSLIICAFSQLDYNFYAKLIVFEYDSSGNFTPVIGVTDLDINFVNVKYKIQVKINNNNKVLICSSCSSGVVECELMQLVILPNITMSKLGIFEEKSCKIMPYHAMLKDNDEIIIACSTLDLIMINQYSYDNSLNKINVKHKGQIKIAIADDHRSILFDELKQNVMIFKIWLVDYETVLYFFHEPKCNIMSICAVHNHTFQFHFSQIEDSVDEEFLLFKTSIDGIYGKMYIDDETNSLVNILLDIQYPFSTNFKLIASNSLGETNVKYYIQTKSFPFDFSTSECELTVKIIQCFSTCAICLKQGNDINHECVTCASDHYKYLTDDIGNCYKNDNTISSTWYLHEGFFYECSPVCNGCSGNQQYDTITKKYNTFCLTCADNAFLYHTLPECRNNAIRESNIFFSSYVKEYYDCFENCATCTEMNNETSMNCDTCIEGTIYNSSTKNCNRNNFPTPSYHGEYDQYYPCFNTCASCRKKGSNSNHNCDSCLSSYYLMKDLNSCMFKDQIITSLPGYYIDNIMKIIYSCYFSCSECKGIGSLTAHDCITCQIGSYNKKDSNNCYSLNDNTEGLYLNTKIIPFTWFACLIQCKTCENGFSCITCIPNTYFFQNNCYEVCPTGTKIFFSECVINCPKESTQVLNQCHNIFNPPSPSNESTIKITELSKEELIDILTNDLAQFADENIIKGNDYLIQVISRNNTNNTHINAINYNLILLTPHTCLIELSNHYNITEDDILIIKIDLNTTKSPINQLKVLYFNSNNNMQLNESGVCDNAEIPVIFPIVNSEMIDFLKAQTMMNQRYDIFDPNDDFYNSPCTPYTSENDLDITIEKRRTDLFKNISLCQNGCVYQSVDLNNLTASCQCKKIGDFTLNEIILDFKTNILSTNIDVIKCYKLVFTGDILCNKGFLILLSFIIFKTILVVYILIKGFKKFISNLNFSKKETLKKLTNSNDPTLKDIQISPFVHKKYKKIVLSNYKPATNIGITTYENDMSKINKKSFEFKQAIKDPITNMMIIIYTFIKIKHPILNTFFYPRQFDFQILNVIIFFNSIAINFSLNALFYTNAYINERYISKGAFDFLFTFPKSIFVYLIGLIFNIILSLCINPHRNVKNHMKKEKKKKNKEIKEIQESKENILQSNAFNTPNKVLLNQIPNNNAQLKIENNINIQSSGQGIDILQIAKTIIDTQIKSIVKRIKIKIAVFLSLNYLLMLLFLYYVTCFCAVNKNSQNDWLISCIISLAIAMCVPIILCFIFGIIKWIALKCKCETLYVMNDIISITD